MLNELLLIERGAKQAGIEMAQRHPDVKDARQIPTLLVRLDERGDVAEVRPIARQITPWTLRDAQQNSFPFAQPKRPLWKVPASDQRVGQLLDRKFQGKHEVLIQLVDRAEFNADELADWPGRGLLERLAERLSQIRGSEDARTEVVVKTFERFLAAFAGAGGPSAPGLLQQIAKHLVRNLRVSAGTEWVEIAIAVLLEGTGGFMFDATGANSVLDAGVVAGVSAALRAHAGAGDSDLRGGCCALTGVTGPLVASKFPQPNLPLLGQTYLFARNKDIPANDRYGRFSADSMPVGQDTAIRLAAAIEALTADHRKGVTWRSIPGESPDQTDLLLAFVEAVPEAEVVPMLVDGEGEGEDELPSEEEIATRGNTVANYEQRTQRLVEAVRAKFAPIDKTPVRYAVFRRVDPANRKVSYQGQVAVSELARAAEDWAAGERNVPWVRLPVPVKGARQLRAAEPPHVAPLALISFSKQAFIRGGRERQEITGLPAGEALSLFLEHDRARAARVLRLVLARRALLVAGAAHAMRKGLDAVKEYDRGETLKTVTVLGLLLHKLGRGNGTSEDYMSHEAFKFGQLLAAVDVVHAGYCADVRGGDLPPALLGNQVFTMAQTSPVKALNALARRWKPYAGWAMKSARSFDRKANRRRDELMRESKNRGEAQRGWDITRALAVARRVQPLIDELRAVVTRAPDDLFRAEVLLGYIAGVPRQPGEASMNEGQAAEAVTTEA
ncbi:MAG TPA: hypothetical protein VGI81_00790 [Tepidisphaeraceae bacterium]|jgi:hypothetical protein